LTLIGIMIMLLNWNVCLNWIEQHPTLFSALSSVGALLSAIFSFRSIKQTLNLRNEDRIEAAKLRNEDRIEAAKLRNEDRMEAAKLRNEDRMEAAKFRREDREKFETELANTVDIAKSTKQQAISMKRLATVLEKQLEILEEKKLRVTTHHSWISDNPNDILSVMYVSLNITNPTKQTIKINSIIINDNSPFNFMSACYRDLSYLPQSLGTLHYIYPQQEKHLCLKKPRIDPPIHSDIDPFSLRPSGLLGLIIGFFLMDRNSEIPLILTMEHTAINPVNPPQKVTFCPEYFNIKQRNKLSELLYPKQFSFNK
ncbi:hypothetical protein MCQ_00931, partial [Candidatus Bartonella washoeensis Sb944nv]